MSATEAQADRAIAVLKRAIEAAENGNQAGENFVVQAAASPDLYAALAFVADVARTIPGFSPLAIQTADQALAKARGETGRG